MFKRTKVSSAFLTGFSTGLLIAAPGAFAQDATAVQRVEITGSSIKRVDAETSVPVTVISADQLKKAGVTSVEQVLQSVSSVQVQLTSAQAVGAGTGGGAEEIERNGSSISNEAGEQAARLFGLGDGRRCVSGAEDAFHKRWRWRRQLGGARNVEDETRGVEPVAEHVDGEDGLGVMVPMGEAGGGELVGRGDA